MTLALAAWSWTATLLLAAPSSDGVVVLPDGAPAADAVVWVVSRSLDTLRQVRTDAEGRFSIAAADGADDPLFQAPVQGFVVDLPGHDLLVAGLQDLPRPLRLRSASPLPVRVVDETGAGAAGALVETTVLGTFTYARLPHPWNGLRLAGLGATCDEEGRCTVRRVWYAGIEPPPGQELWARAERAGTRSLGRANARDMVARDAATRPRQEVVLALRPAITVRGTLVDAQAATPLAGADLSVLGLQPRGRRTQTDEQGRFSFEQLATIQPPVLELRHPLLETAQAQVRCLEDADPRGVVDLWIPISGPHWRTGRVVDAHSGGPPLTPVELSVQSTTSLIAGWELSLHLSHGQSGQECLPDAEGRFAMHIPAGPGTLHVRGPRGSARAAYDHTIEIDLVDEAKPDDALQIALSRRTGLLLRNSSRLQALTDPALGGTGSLILSASPLTSRSTSYASEGELWFFPLDAWGDRLRVQAHWRRPGEDRLVLDRELVADPDAWPVLLDLDEDRSAGHSARPPPSESKFE